MEKDIKENRLERLEGKQPFRVPDGYMEGLTSRIMEGLPESPTMEVKSVSLMERIRPWLYLAAVFAGMGLFFKAIIGIEGAHEDSSADSLLVHSELPSASLEAIESETVQEEADYLEYIEERYVDYLLKESLTESE
ncbi:MAG: hypothetical protein ACI3ZY_04860 [Parabacteroides sp.]